MRLSPGKLDRGISEYTTFRSFQSALNRVGDEVFKRYCEKARRAGTTPNELSGLARLVGDVDPSVLTPAIGLELALDAALPDHLRLESFCLSAPPLDARAWPVVWRVLDSDYYTIALKAIGRTADPEQTVLELLHDPTLGAERQRRIIRNPMALFPDPDRRISCIKRCAKETTLTPEVRDTMQVFAARYGDREAIENLIDRLATLELSIAGAIISLLGHHTSQDLGVRAAEAARSRVMNSEEAVSFAHHAATGLTSIFQMDSFQAGVLAPSPPHPALNEWAELVETWMDQFDFSEIQRFRLLTAATQLGSDRAIGILERLISQLSDPDDSRYDEEDPHGQHLHRAMYQLRRKRRILPLEVGERFARASRFALPYSGIEAIAAHADRNSLDLLLRLHNAASNWELRSTLSAEIETLAGRLGLSILREETHALKVSESGRRGGTEFGATPSP